MARYCTKCGNDISGKAQCDRCGAVVNNQNTQPTPAYNHVYVAQPADNSNKGGTTVLIVLVAILLLVVIVFGVAIGTKLLLDKDDEVNTVVIEERDGAPVYRAPQPDNKKDEDAGDQVDGYLFPSNVKRITENDLATLTQNEVALIRNEIYARHGYIFQTEEYADYFSKKSWYKPSLNFDESMFNEIEKYNKDFIVEYETRRGWR